MENSTDTTEISREQRRKILFWFLMVEAVILLVTGIILGNCFEIYQTAATL